MANKPKGALAQKGALLPWLQEKESKNKQLRSSKAKGCQFRLPIQTSPKGDLSVKPLIEESDEVCTDIEMEQIGG